MSDHMPASEKYLRNIIRRLLDLYVQATDDSWPDDPFIDHCRHISKRHHPILSRPIARWGP